MTASGGHGLIVSPQLSSLRTLVPDPSTSRSQMRGGHVILLNPEGSGYYEATKGQALKALRAYPGGLQAGGGTRPESYFLCIITMVFPFASSVPYAGRTADLPP